jgi:alpha-L-rhamnosidase
MPAKTVREQKPGVFIYDLGQNISGVIRLKVRGKPGDKVTIRYAEVLHNDGRLSTENLRCARAVDTYTLKGDPAGETWVPEFTYHGFQYVELTGFPGTPGLEAVTGIVIHSDTPRCGGFECSDAMLNKLYQNMVWTQRSNFFEMPTDCPQRDERMGWTGDAQIYVRAATLNADIASRLSGLRPSPACQAQRTSRRRLDGRGSDLPVDHLAGIRRHASHCQTLA